MTASQEHVAECRRIRERLERRFDVDLRARRDEGLVQAEAFRRDLVNRGRDVVLAEAIVDFCRLASERKLLAGRPGLGGFAGLTTKGVAEAIRGTGGQRLDGEAAFGRFTGRWFGLWERMKVDHAWDRIDHDPPPLGPEGMPRPLSEQFAWLGEAFCYHIVAALPQRLDARIILGTVHHIRGDKIEDPVPHVAVAAPQGRLVWITPQHVFCEEVTPDERYVITGFAYAITAGRLSIKDNRGFQAIYTRSPADRPRFFTFGVSLGE